MFETLIVSYSRGTTQLDFKSPLFSCTIIHAAWITGAVPGSAYLMIYRSDCPRKSIRPTSPYCIPTISSSLKRFRKLTSLSHRFG